MANTVIGFFDNADDTQEAVDLLTQSGIQRSQIDISSGRQGSSDDIAYNADGAGATSSGQDTTMSNTGTEEHSGSHKGNAITNFFRSLFGDDDAEADRYS